MQYKYGQRLRVKNNKLTIDGVECKFMSYRYHDKHNCKVVVTHGWEKGVVLVLPVSYLEAVEPMCMFGGDT